MTPGTFLKQSRKAMGWSPTDVALATGISRSRIECIESNRRKMLDLKTCVRLCDHYRVSILVLAAIVGGKPLGCAGL